MGVYYFLVCIECKSGIQLGKAIRARYNNINHTTFGFDALGGERENGWTFEQKTMETLQHFLMLHRTHELRVLPDTVQKFTDSFPHSCPYQDDDIDPRYDRRKFLESSVGVPNSDKEVEELPEELVEKLKTF